MEFGAPADSCSGFKSDQSTLGHPDLGRSSQDLAGVLSGVEELSASIPARQRDRAHEELLVKKRLGIASSLFLALRAKHPPTAEHSLRVALGCSSWALAAEMSDSFCDDLEVAALLHDIGKIGVPDRVLLKPGRLVGEELLLMERRREVAQEIVQSCCDSSGLLEIIRYCGAWYNGQSPDFDRRGAELPLGSRMMAIVDAFDSMTTDHVYRRAMPRERALGVLLDGVGTQFDPRLVHDFVQLVAHDKLDLSKPLVRRWLRELSAEQMHEMLRAEPGPSVQTAPTVPTFAEFHSKLADNIYDGVVFLDADLRVTYWNRAAERLTGIAASSVIQKQFLPSLLQLRQDPGGVIPDHECPVANALSTGAQALKRATIVGRGQRALAVNLHLIPIIGDYGERKGVAMVIHDASSQVSLEERVQALHERATQDPLTKVANRAEFDRVLAEFIEAHMAERVPCSLIICDIDHFKRINDVHGHQAGDAALVHFAVILRNFCRPGDLVARYGGEEFVLLCADCDNVTATRRADRIRIQVGSTRLAELDQRSLTASFGVTEIQAGDTAETMLRRADRALLRAKDTGRDRVVQLGVGMRAEEPLAEPPKTWLQAWFHPPPEICVSRTLVTSVPLNLAAEKLKGFISDHHAEVLELAGNRVRMKIEGPSLPLMRRHDDRPVAFLMEVQFREFSEEGADARLPRVSRTSLDLVIRPSRRRDRRHRDLEQRARHLLMSVKAYFMAVEAVRGSELNNPPLDDPPVGDRFSSRLSISDSLS